MYYSETEINFSDARAISKAYYGAGSGLIHLDKVQCTGDEEDLLSCTYTQDHNCYHYEDAGVDCLEANCTEGDVRLFGRVKKAVGYVEICLNGSWNGLCPEYLFISGWSYNNARVVCKQLGYPYTGIIIFACGCWI